MRLALFDLDHTLIPFDSGMAWTRFLVRRGRLPAEAEALYLSHCFQYVAGTLDIHAMHRATMAPLSHHAPDELARWAVEFEQEIAPEVPDEMRALVQRHQDGGDLCALVTATTRLVAEPFARLFGLRHLVATEATLQGGRYTGEIDGDPCFREHKPTRVARWLAGLPEPPRELSGFEASWFYSDSASDLPLLAAVSNPVAVRPDERLRAHAAEAGWLVI